MTFRLAAFFALSWGLMAIFGAIMELSATPGADDPTRQMLNAFSAPVSVEITDPTMGEGEGESVISSFWQAGATATGWLGAMARAATLDFPWWQGSLQIVRYIMLLLAAPFVFIVAREGFQLLMSIFRGISGVAGSLGRVVSDARAKKNVEPIGRAIAAVRRIRGVRFEYASPQFHGTGKRLGVIAQDVEAVAPEAVDREGDLALVRYDALVALLFSAFNEHLAEHDLENDL